MMVTMGDMVFVLGLLVTAHCAVRARDPELEEEEMYQGPDNGSWDQGTGVFPGPPPLRPLPYGHRHEGRLPSSHRSGHQGHQGQPQLGLPEVAVPQAGEGEHHTTRTRNWCSFVHRRVVTMAVACGTERYTIKSQSPCPNGMPDCQLVMYKLSTRPVYKEKQNIFTSLLWRCCPGHGGKNCEENAPDDQATDSPSLVGQPHPGLETPASQTAPQQEPGDLDLVQNDFQGPSQLFYDAHGNDTDVEGEALHHPPQDQGPSPVSEQSHLAQHRPQPHGPQHIEQQRSYDYRSPITDEVDQGPMLHPEATSVLPLPHMLALIMSQLQPLLEGYNSTLERLSQQIGGLSQDVALLKSSRWGMDVEGDALGRPESADGVEEFDAKLDEVFQNIDEVKRQLDSHRHEMVNSLHAQHLMLHSNFTLFKMDVDLKLKRNHKMLQTNLQSMNSTLADMRQEQERLAEGLAYRDPAGQERVHRLPTPQPLHPDQPLEAGAIWEAIARLDAKVINNTVRLDTLAEDLEVADENISDLAGGYHRLDEKIGQTGRNSQIQFMETGLEVEAAKDRVLTRVGELAANLTLHTQQLQEMEIDVDYLYTLFYKNASSTTECNCQTTKALIWRLEKSLANVTELARDNRRALDSSAEARVDLWEDVGGWESSVEDLRHGLQQVRDSLAHEQLVTATVQRNVSLLGISVLGCQEDSSTVRESNRQQDAEIRRLSGSFQSLLNDAIRHTDVLEMLLGEEVLEFLDRSVRDREAHSVPALQEKIRSMQEQISGHDRSLGALLGRGGAAGDTPVADQPPDLVEWFNRGLERKGGEQRREQQRLDSEDHGRIDYGDGGDLWTLEKTVEALGAKLQRLEEKLCPGVCNNSSSNSVASSGGVDEKLQAEVARLKRGLEDHLRVFKNVFSNTDGLEGSESTVDLDKLWALLKQKDSKRERNKRVEKKKGSKDGLGRRSRRDISAHTSNLRKLEDKPLLMVAQSLRALPKPGPLVFEKSQTRHGAVYSHKTGSFIAPVKGTYLFVLTLELQPGPTRVSFSRTSGGFTTLHHGDVTEGEPVTTLRFIHLVEGEELQLELREGALMSSTDSTMAGFLLQRTT